MSKLALRPKSVVVGTWPQVRPELAAELIQHGPGAGDRDLLADDGPHGKLEAVGRSGHAEPGRASGLSGILELEAAALLVEP